MVRYVFLTVLVLLVCLSCCTSTDGDGNGYDQTTVLGTLNLFLQVWNDGDVDAYEGLLDEDTFTFFFDPSDVGHGLPFSWDYDEETAAYTGLFDAVGAEKVDVQLDFSEVTEPEEGSDTYKVEEIPYEVRVHVEEEDVIYIARGNLDMQLEKIGGVWVITDWWDRVSWRLPGVEETTWGAIKAHFFY